jgi:hypothetical protein
MFGLKNPFPKVTEVISGVLIGKAVETGDTKAIKSEGKDKDKDKEKEKVKDKDKKEDNGKGNEKDKKAKVAAVATKAKAVSTSNTTAAVETYEEYLIGCVGRFPLLPIIAELME